MLDIILYHMELILFWICFVSNTLCCISKTALDRNVPWFYALLAPVHNISKVKVFQVQSIVYII